MTARKRFEVNSRILLVWPPSSPNLIFYHHKTQLLDHVVVWRPAILAEYFSGFHQALPAIVRCFFSSLPLSQSSFANLCSSDVKQLNSLWRYDVTRPYREFRYCCSNLTNSSGRHVGSSSEVTGYAILFQLQGNLSIGVKCYSQLIVAGRWGGCLSSYKLGRYADGSLNIGRAPIVGQEANNTLVLHAGNGQMRRWSP